MPFDGTAMPGSGPEPGPATRLTLIPQARLAAAVDVWDSALCAQVDPEIFFPEKGGSTRQATQVCVGCPVRIQCLDYAMTNDERFGVWGGLSETQRHNLKQRNAA